MKTIQIKVTGTNNVNTDYIYKPYICLLDSTMPKVVNRGYNTYDFKDNVELLFSNMPVDETKTRETDKYKWEQSEIVLIDSNNDKALSGRYTKTTFKETGVIQEMFHF